MKKECFERILQSISFEIQRIYKIKPPPLWPAISETDNLVEKASDINRAGAEPDRQPKDLCSIFDLIGEPGERHVLPTQDHQARIRDWFAGSAKYPDQADSVQSLLESLEDNLAQTPSDIEGVSLYHRIKMTAAVACVLQTVQDQNPGEKEPFLLYSLDFSGIQQFIYTIISSGALKALRVRSFYLSLLSEYATDFLLDATGLSRFNLIYSGGGRTHLLLPNVASVISAADQAVSAINQFLLDHFGASLYLASGYAKTSGEALTSHHGAQASFAELFRTASRMISNRKLSRYNYEELYRLNTQAVSDGVRECAVCGETARLTRCDDTDLCITCYQLEQFSSVITSSEDLFCVVEGSRKDGLALPSPDGHDRSLVPWSLSEEADALSVYSINKAAPEHHAIRLYVSRHQADYPTLEELAEKSKGIRRLGVFRGDVDNLGSLFAGGFVQRGRHNAWERCTLMHYASLSAALSAFFQQRLDHILEQPCDTEALEAADNGSKVSVIYAGGDDVFLIGAWNDVLEAGLKLQKAFAGYTSGKITMSAGLGVYQAHTPVHLMAEDTADLESYAKQMPEKDAIALFGRFKDQYGTIQKHEYRWNDLHNSVLQEKLQLLESLFQDVQDKGNGFLYHVLILFREMAAQPMAISRLAYLLARHQPDSRADPSVKAAYHSFMTSVYSWALDPVQNQAFQTACLIYVYLNRSEEKQKEE